MTPNRVFRGPVVPGQAPHEGLRVLVVDDHPMNRKLARAMLRAAGVESVAAVDGHDAIALWRQDARFDLLLMDWEMPGLHGGATTHAIRQLPGGHDVPVVALTAHALPEIFAQCLAHGIDGCLVKPLLELDLVRVLTGCRAGRSGVVELAWF